MTRSDLEQIDEYSRKHILRSTIILLSEHEVSSSTLAMIPITGDFHLLEKNPLPTGEIQELKNALFAKSTYQPLESFLW